MVKSRNMSSKKPKKVRKVKVVRSESDDLDAPAVAAANMYYDPCGSTLVPTVYPGDRGYVNRFASTFNLGTTAGDTFTLCIFKPGVQVMYTVSGASALTSGTITYADTLAPGAAFTNSNASKIRCAGACITYRPLSTPNNATGMIYYGVVPASSVPEGATLIPQALLPLLTNSVSATQALLNPLEIKFSPGAFDDRYCPPVGITADDDTDRNVIIVLANGLPSGGGATLRATAIYEWTPTVGSAVVIDSTSVKPSRCDFNCVLRNLKRKDPEWWWALGRKVLRGGTTVAKAYLTAGAPGAVMAASRFL